jgi:hypothetical protein
MEKYKKYDGDRHLCHDFDYSENPEQTESRVRPSKFPLFWKVTVSMSNFNYFTG